MAETPLKDGEYEVKDGDTTWLFKIRTAGPKSLIQGQRLIMVNQGLAEGVKKPWLKFGFISDDGVLDIWKRYQYNDRVDPALKAAARIVADGVFVRDLVPYTGPGGWKGKNPDDE